MNCNLLYVEDDKTLRTASIDIFEDLFKNIFIAKNGNEGLDIFNSKDIDIIITDLKMPVMNGISMINEIRKKNKNIPILVLSAFNDLSVVNNAKSCV